MNVGKEDKNQRVNEDIMEPSSSEDDSEAIPATDEEQETAEKHDNERTPNKQESDSEGVSEFESEEVGFEERTKRREDRPMIIRAAENKRSTFPRKFTYEDEIKILKGLATFWPNGIENNWAQFHPFIENRLSFQPSKTQVSEKVRGLKKKFDKNLERGRVSFPNAHEELLFELSHVFQNVRGEKGKLDDERDGKKKAKRLRTKDDHDEEKELRNEEKELQKEEMKLLLKRLDLECKRLQQYKKSLIGSSSSK